MIKWKIVKYLVLLIIILSGFFYVADIDRMLGKADLPGTARDGKVGATYPDREQLQRKFYEERRALLIYGGSDPRYAARYRAFADSLRGGSRWIQFRIKSDTEVTENDLRGVTLYLVGTPSSNRIIAKIAPELPVKISANSFIFYERTYDDPADILTLFYPNPLDSTYGVTVICGNEDEHLLNAVTDMRSLVWGMPGDYRVWRGDRVMVFGSFSQVPETRWKFDLNAHRDLARGTRLAAQTAHYRFYLHEMQLAPAEMEAIAERHEQQLGRLKTFLGLRDSLPAIAYHIYPSFEAKGMATGNTTVSHFDRSGRAVLSVVRPEIRGDDFLKDASLLLQEYLGKPARLALETGLSVYFSVNWHGKGYEYWAARLHASGNGTTLADLLNDPMFRQESQLVMEPLAGSFVAMLLQKFGREALREHYRSWEPGPGEVATLHDEWMRYLDSLAARYASRIAADRAVFPHSDAFQKGFCHAHEGYRIYNGYLSRKSDEALEKLRALGSNAVSITPFSYMRDPHRPVFLRHSRSAGSENDESIIHAAWCAHKLGMTVMLKPHIWLGGGSWPGDIEMRSEPDWQKFFDYYYRWMRHYAVLAEMYQMETLCVGVELGQTTAAQPEKWRELIRRLGQLYSGKMTYAANWGREFEKMSFWDALDYIGLNCYYPLSNSDRADDAALRAGVRNICERIEPVQRRYGKPVILTEIGFTSTPAPWLQPHESARRKPVNLADQARSYAAVFQEFYGRKWLRGIYWWKWPTYLEYGGPQDNDFTPNGKPAESVVAEWYGKPWD